MLVALIFKLRSFHQEIAQLKAPYSENICFLFPQELEIIWAKTDNPSIWECLKQFIVLLQSHDSGQRLQKSQIGPEEALVLGKMQ